MAVHVQPAYTAKCDECGELACGGCYNHDKNATIRCAIGCGWRKANDNSKVLYCQGCRSEHVCSACGGHFEKLNDDKKCEGCAKND